MAFCYSPQVVDGSYNISVKFGSSLARLVLATFYGKIRNKQSMGYDDAVYYDII